MLQSFEFLSNFQFQGCYTGSIRTAIRVCLRLHHGFQRLIRGLESAINLQKALGGLRVWGSFLVLSLLGFEDSGCSGPRP